jgi:hypothetical protein
MIKQNKYISFLIVVYFVTILFSSRTFGQYNGGAGPGFSYGEENNTCTLSSIFAGTISDGFSFLASLQTCQSRLYTVGGNGNGFSLDTSLTNCPVNNIYTGNSNDGYGFELHSLCPKDSLVIQIEVLAQPSCTTPTLGSVTVSVVDGYPVWLSVANFTYIWKDEFGDTLSGYPLTKSSKSDTVINLAIGAYTIIVYDANLKIDSATIYINDCLYRGGSGPGFAADSSLQNCLPTSIYTNSGNDGSDVASSLNSCDFYLFSKGGNGNGFALDTNTQNCLTPQIYTGESGDGYAVIAELLICESRLFSVGGSGNGFAADTVTQACVPLNIFKGTEGDGFDYVIDTAICISNIFSTGGNGNGFAADTNTQNCIISSIYTNTGNDGFDYATDILNCESVLFTHGGNGNGFSVDTSTQLCNPPNIYTGNINDGFVYTDDIPCLKDSIVITASILDQITCPVAIDNGIASVSVVEGFPDWRSIPNYTYIWKNSAGDTLAGYPRISSETADTIYNLGVDEYTVIVSDAGGNIDSAQVYINDCLYRGGDGPGFSTDSVLNNCLLSSIYGNSGDDGFDYAIDTPLCIYALYSSGGNGNGFAIDTSTQNCQISSIYSNTGDDGFDYVTDILSCDMTYFSSGGDGSGFSSDTATQLCSLPVIYTGEQADGADQLYNGCTPYIYELPSTNNTCLDADTIVSNGSNQWQLILRNGQVVAAIKDNGNNLGNITTKFYVNDNAVRVDPFAILPSYYLDRNYKISTENLIFGAPVRVRLYFLSNELQALITADVNVSSINSIGITRYHGQNENCTITDNVDNNENVNYLHYDTYDWDTYENGYYVEFDVNSFSEFYINNSSSLPTPYEITADISVSSDYNGSDISCYGSADGEATITPTYGIAPFTYQWDDPLLQTDSIATGLSAGMYHVTIVDNNSVTYSDSILITQPDSISFSSTSTDACQGTNDGTIDLTVSGGTIVTDYTFTWSTLDGSGLIPAAEDQSTLSGGKYNITVADANSCTQIDSVIILENLASTDPTGINVMNNNTCLGTTKTLSPNGGVLGYNASWNWYSEAACTNLLNTGATFDVDPVISTDYWLRAEGDCDTTAVVTATVSVLTSSVVADSISKTDDNIAPGTNDTLVIHGGTLGAGASWKWYLDAGGTISAGSDNDTLIVAPLVTTQYWARAEGTCNNTAMVSTTVTINPLPLKPATPVGVDTLCQNAVNTAYTTTGATGATSYIWSITPPAAGTITGTGLTGTVDWSATYYEAVTITVTGENGSGTGPESDPLIIWIWKTPETGPTYHIDNTWE